MNYFEDIAINGDLEEVEKYLSGFTKFDDNEHSMKIFYLIRKTKYIEAVNRGYIAKAVDMLLKDVQECSRYNKEDFGKIMLLLTEEKRDNEQPSRNAREPMLDELKKLIRANPLFHDKLNFPSLMNSRLKTLIKQSLYWQHRWCSCAKRYKTLFVDHSCESPNVASTPPPVNVPLMGSAPRLGGFPSGRAHATTPAPLLAFLARLLSNVSSILHQTSAAGPIAPIVPFSDPGQSHVDRLNASNDLLPKAVVANLGQGSFVKSMDFHPVQQNLLLVGTDIGDLSIWELGIKERLVSREFKVWNLSACSMTLQASLEYENAASVNRVIWSPDSFLLGVAYSKHIVHMYLYLGGDNLQNHLEIDAHVGNVSDLAFSCFYEAMCLITCGEDKMIKVWDAVTGINLYTLEGQEAPVYSVCQYDKFFFSMAIDGKIKAWLFGDISTDECEMVSSEFLQIPHGRLPSATVQIRVHFHQDQIHVLAVHASQIAIYKAPSLECLKQWSPPISNGAIMDSIYSCDGQSVYAACEDGSVNVLTAMTLQLKCWISPNEYLPSNPSQRMYPVVVAAHPTEPNQFALGFSDGGIRVISWI